MKGAAPGHPFSRMLGFQAFELTDDSKGLDGNSSEYLFYKVWRLSATPPSRPFFKWN